MNRGLNCFECLGVSETGINRGGRGGDGGPVRDRERSAYEQGAAAA